MTDRALAKRDQIRAGARRVFLEHGFAGASTDAIAAEAGVSKQTLYAYYPSKEELLAGVLEWMVGGVPLESFSPGKIELESREDLRRVLTAVAQGVVDRMMQPEYMAILRVIIAEMPRLPHLGELYRRTIPERGLKNVVRVLEHARERGLAEFEDADIASRALVGPVVTHGLLDGLLVEGEPRKPDPERIEKMVELYMKAIA